jgi:hypothetical protein
MLKSMPWKYDYVDSWHDEKDYHAISWFLFIRNTDMHDTFSKWNIMNVSLEIIN